MKLRWLPICVLVFAALVSAPVFAQEAQGECNLVTMFNGWSSAVSAGSTGGVVFGLLVNLGSQPDTLLGASTEVADSVELNSTSMDANGAMQMNAVEGGIPVPANGYTELKSGGLHIMLVNLKEPLQAGGTLDLTLNFEHAGEVPVSVPIREMMATDDSMPAEPSSGGMDMPMMSKTEVPAQAWDAACQNLYVLGAWARPNIPGAPNSAAYALLLNLTSTDETLTSVSTAVAQAADVHEMIMGDNDVMQMRPVEGGVTIPAGGAVLLQPGGLHIMLIELTSNLEDGGTFDITLTFANSGARTISVPIHPPEDDSMGGM